MYVYNWSIQPPPHHPHRHLRYDHDGGVEDIEKKKTITQETNSQIFQHKRKKKNFIFVYIYINIIKRKTNRECFVLN